MPFASWNRNSVTSEFVNREPATRSGWRGAADSPMTATWAHGNGPSVAPALPGKSKYVHLFLSMLLHVGLQKKKNATGWCFRNPNLLPTISCGMPESGDFGKSNKTHSAILGSKAVFTDSQKKK